MKTNKNFTEAENEIFTYWEYNDGILTHKPSGKHIYQMYWLDDNGYKAEPVVGEVRDQVVAFWLELRTLKEADETARRWASIKAVPSSEDIARAKFAAAMEDEYSDL